MSQSVVLHLHLNHLLLQKLGQVQNLSLHACVFKIIAIVKHDQLHMTKASTIASSFLGGGRFPRSLAISEEGTMTSFLGTICNVHLQDGVAGVPSLEQVAAIITAAEKVYT